MALRIDQYDLFDNPTDTDLLRSEVIALKESQNRVRRRTFATLKDLTEMLINQQREIDQLRRLLVKEVR